MEKNIMNKMRRVWAFAFIAAMLLCASCTNDEGINTPQVIDNGNNTTKIIHYSAIVDNSNNNNNNSRRAQLNGSMEYEFATGDKLYVEGTDIYGVLTLATGNGSNTATFEGDLIYSGSGEPDNDLALNAILVSINDELHTITDDKVTATIYPSTAIASTLSEAVEKYSHFTSSSTFGAKSFSLDQQSAFLNFNVTFTNGTATGAPLAIEIRNGGNIVRTGTTTTTTISESIVAKFVSVFPAGTAGTTDLLVASLRLGNLGLISFGGSTSLEKNKIYNIRKTVASLRAVDLGLSVKWANMNVGAANVTDFGRYYAWGATTDYYTQGLAYNWDNAPYYTGNGTYPHSWSKYNTTDENVTLRAEDDAATQNCGGTWRMPTKEEMLELKNNTTTTEYFGANKYNGANGILFTSTKVGYTDKSIFMPATGQLEGLTGFRDLYTYGNYWSSTLCTNESSSTINYNDGYLLYFRAGGALTGMYMRYYGFTIRAVKP